MKNTFFSSLLNLSIKLVYDRGQQTVAHGLNVDLKAKICSREIFLAKSIHKEKHNQKQFAIKVTIRLLVKQIRFKGEHFKRKRLSL